MNRQIKTKNTTKITNTHYRTEKERLLLRAHLAGIPNAEQMTKRQLRRELERMENPPDLRKFNADPRRTIRETILSDLAGFISEEVEVSIIKDGKVKKERKSRLRLLLEKLFKRAMQEEDVAAIRELFDRTIGKAPVQLEMDANIHSSSDAENDAEKTAMIVSSLVKQGLLNLQAYDHTHGTTRGGRGGAKGKKGNSTQ